jgi:uncharacterized protein (UPF0276 family)
MAQVRLLDRMAKQVGAPWVSEHLSFNKFRGAGEEVFTGFLLPPRQTPSGVAVAAASIRAMSRHLAVPLAVETGVNYLRPREDEIPDGRFLSAVANAADCGLLLDLHNLWANDRNGRQPLESVLNELPLERVWEVHLAGGFEHKGYWLDAHSGGIPEPLVELARRVLPKLPSLRALIFELTPSAVSAFGATEVREQLEALNDLWTLRGTAGKTPVAPSLVALDPVSDGDARAWESALGSLVVGRPTQGRLVRELTTDPGISLLRGLVEELRSSTVVSTLKLTSRLLLLSLGPERFREFLQDYLRTSTPRLFASDEVERFSSYVDAASLEVPFLHEVLAFERATLATLMDGEAREAEFDFEPISVLRALAEGRLPGQATPGRFRIRVTGDEAIDLDDYRSWSSFWPH